jgi:hypothetical protein
MGDMDQKPGTKRKVPEVPEVSEVSVVANDYELEENETTRSGGNYQATGYSRSRHTSSPHSSTSKNGMIAGENPVVNALSTTSTSRRPLSITSPLPSPSPGYRRVQNHPVTLNSKAKRRRRKNTKRIACNNHNMIRFLERPFIRVQSKPKWMAVHVHLLTFPEHQHFGHRKKLK